MVTKLAVTAVLLLGACGGESVCEGDLRCRETPSPLDADSGGDGTRGDAAAPTSSEALTPWWPDDPWANTPSLITSFTSLTLHSSGGNPGASGSCSQAYLDVFTLDAQSRTLSSDYCGSSGGVSSPVQRSRVLTEQELQATQNVLSVIGISDWSTCGYDKPWVSLEVEANGSRDTYWDDFYGCQRSDPSRRYIHSISPLETWIKLLASDNVMPKDITTISMRRSPHFEVAPDTSSSCDQVTFSEYKLDLSSRMLEWQECRAAPGSNVYALAMGARALSSDEVRDLLASYAKLVPGASKPCAELPTANDHFSSVTVTTAGMMSANLFDEAASCSRRWDGGSYVVNLPAFEQSIAALAR